MKRAQLAINSVSTRTHDLETILAAYEMAGFVHVEFSLKHVYDYLDAGHTSQDVVALLRQHHLDCIGGFETPALCFGAAEQRTQNHDRIVANCQLLAELGGSTLVLGTDGPEPSQEAADPVGVIAATFAELGERVQSTGGKLCVEFNWSPIVKSVRTAVEVARRSGADNVGVLFDPAHYHCTPSKLEMLDVDSVPYIGHVHVDDMADKPGELSNCNADRALPGEGCLDLGQIFGRLEQFGYDGYFSIEMFDEELWAMPPTVAAKRMYDSLLPLCSH
ncbi:MAG: sugar phosphate isomerase/epimerase family protein [Candidatus Latescibacteria bacterium]|jgi:4-hydroxyphenylpyruvate dioxygenase|nr:sugar phosphate isomerase/epimerase family protein [Candidatus Latescibacterota bacterium]|tara:strand:+ start:3339 stop:4166 length:828 start_codon:yes stop_codon:yes gene_type:complete